MICCMLFFRFEIGENNYADAMFHFANGIKIMNSSRSKGQRSSSNLSTSSHGAIDSHIADLFSGLLFNLLPSATCPREASQDHEQLPTPSSRIISAGHSLRDLTTEVFQFLQLTMISQPAVAPQTSTMLPGYTHLRNELESWRSEFMPLPHQGHNCAFFPESLMDELSRPQSPTHEIIAASLLEVQYPMLIISLDGTRQPSRELFVILVGVFERIISLSELLTQTVSTETGLFGNDDLALLPQKLMPLFQNIKLCRESALRWLAAHG